jgi:hypothetical protein
MNVKAFGLCVVVRFNASLSSVIPVRSPAVEAVEVRWDEKPGAPRSTRTWATGPSPPATVLFDHQK